MANHRKNHPNRQTNITANLRLLPKIYHHHIYIPKTNLRPAITQFPYNPIMAQIPRRTPFLKIKKCKQEFQSSSTQTHSPKTPNEPMANHS
jgi:hypothetical protein